VDDKISLNKAKELLYRLSGLVSFQSSCFVYDNDKFKLYLISVFLNNLQERSSVNNAFQGMLMLVTENPTSGMNIEIVGNNEDEVIKIKDVPLLDYEQTTISVDGISPPFWCMLYAFGLLIFFYSLYIVISKPHLIYTDYFHSF
jgi:hypothetical protein